MTNKRNLEKRLEDLWGSGDVEDLPLATIPKMFAADEVEDGPPGVLLIDGEAHKVGKFPPE